MREAIESGEGDASAHVFERSALQLVVLEDLDAVAAPQEETHLLAGGERARVAHHLFERHDALLRGGEELFLRLAAPERTKAQRVGTEDDLVRLPRDDGRRALGERAERPTPVAVELLQLLGEARDLAPDGREGDLQCVHQAQVVVEHEALDDAVKHLRVARACGQLDAERARLSAQPVNRVDLAVVAEGGKHLRALGAGVGVGRVAPVSERDGRLEVGVRKLREVAAQGLCVAAHFVDHAVGAERGDVDGQLAFEPQREVEDTAVFQPARRARQGGDLPELRLGGARQRAERVGAHARRL